MSAIAEKDIAALLVEQIEHFHKEVELVEEKPAEVIPNGTGQFRFFREITRVRNQ
jgi:hypothetical protein